MDKETYNRRIKREARSAGFAATLLVHSILIAAGCGAYFSPEPPPNTSLEIIMEDSEPEPVQHKPVQVERGVEPRAERIDRKVELVQRAQAPETGHTENVGKEATMDETGDVSKPEPPRKNKIDTRALFSSNRNSDDTLAAQKAATASDKLVAGHPDGNAEHSRTDGTPTARLKGRTVVGNLPLPDYPAEKAGTVVVKITVDSHGNVTSAIPGDKGTTVQDATLWKAAKEAALKAKFNSITDGSSSVQGTITYLFRLK